MSDPSMPGPAGDLSDSAARAQKAIEELRAPAEQTARAIEDAFSRAGERLALSLARAASDGELSMAELARAVLGSLNALARAPGLSASIEKAVGGLFAGARAEGGPVMGGQAYLVGERGPEVFRPHGAGHIEPVAASAPVSVNVTVAGQGASALLHSEAQVAQALARAVMLGARRL